MLNELQIDMIMGKVCPYCKGKSEFVDSSVIYGTSYGMIYLCRKCVAYCGVHKGTRNSLGRLANSELRFWKKEAHKYFDMVWKTEGMDRSELYKMLSESLSIPPEYCHIGMFSIITCKQVVVWSKTLLNDLRRLDLDMGVAVQRPHYDI